jgi:Phage-related protein
VGIYLPYEQGRGVASLTEIIRMMDGEAWLILSDRPHKRYRAILDNGAEFITWFEGFSEKMATLVFSAEPFGYLIENDPVVCTKSGTRVNNRGNVASEPVLVIEGEGDVNIAIGSQLLQIEGLVSGVPLTIDCESALASEDGVNAAGKITGELPKLSPGFNAITWTGSISTITVTVNARDWADGHHDT